MNGPGSAVEPVEVVATFRVKADVLSSSPLTAETVRLALVEGSWRVTYGDVTVTSIEAVSTSDLIR